MAADRTYIHNRGFVYLALGMSRADGAGDVLMSLFGRIRNAQDRGACAIGLALGLLPQPTEELVSGLIDAHKDDSHPDTVRALAIIGLGSLGDPRAIPLSAMLTRNYNYHIRSLAIDEVALLQ